MRIKVVATYLNNEDESLPKTHVFERDEVIIGRSPQSDLCLEDPTLSAMHAKIFLSPDPQNHGRNILFVKDLGSSNGTALENTQLKPFCEVPLDGSRWVRLGMSLIKATTMDAQEARETVKQIEEQLAEPERLPSEPTLELPSNFSETIVLKDAQMVDDSTPEIPKLSSNVELAPSAAAVEEIEILLDESDAEPTEEIVNALPQEDNSAFIEKISSITPMQAKDPQSTSGKIETSDVLDIDFEAHRLVTISGVVLHHGNPLFGVTLNGGELGEQTTDNNGRFSFGPVREGTAFEIRVSMQDLEFVTDKLSGTAQDNVELEFSTLITFSIGGRVVYRGEPVANVEIDGGPLGKAWTDDDGWYKFNKVSPNTEFELKPSKKGFEFKRRIIKIAA